MEKSSESVLDRMKSRAKVRSADDPAQFVIYNIPRNKRKRIHATVEIVVCPACKCDRKITAMDYKSNICRACKQQADSIAAKALREKNLAQQAIAASVAKQQKRARKKLEIESRKRKSEAVTAESARQYAAACGKKRRMPYHEYIASPQWGAKRRKALKHYKHQCFTCGSCYRLHVHHLHYCTLTFERMEDLRVLCEGCHANTHEGEKPIIMDPMTTEFVGMFQ